MRKKLFAPVLACALCLSLLAVPAAAQDGLSNFQRNHPYTVGHFVDVPLNIWYANYVADAYEMGLFKGVGPDTFAPDGNITIAASLALACRLHSTYYNNGASFVQGEPWYLVYVEYAIQNGIIFPGQFSDYTQDATRRQFAAILAKSLPPAALKQINQVVDGTIPDLVRGSAYYDDIYMLYRAGILTGNDSIGTFGPEDTIRRSHVAAIVTRMADPTLRIIQEAEPTPTPTPSITPSPTPTPAPSASPAPTQGPGSISAPLSCNNNAQISYQLHGNLKSSLINVRCTGVLEGKAAERLVLADNQANRRPGPGQTWQVYELTISCLDGSNLDLQDLFLSFHLRSNGDEAVQLTERQLLSVQPETDALAPGGTVKAVLALLLDCSRLREGLNLGIPTQQGKAAMWIRLDPDGQGGLTPPPAPSAQPSVEPAPAPSAEPSVKPTAPSIKPSPTVTPEPEPIPQPTPPPAGHQDENTGSPDKPLPAQNGQEIGYLHGSVTCPVVVNCIKLDQGDAAVKLALEASSTNIAGENQEWRFYHFTVHYSAKGTETLPVGDLINSGTLYTTDGGRAPVIRTAVINGLRGFQDADTLYLAPGENGQAVLGILVDQSLGDLLLQIRTVTGGAWIELIP